MVTVCCGKTSRKGKAPSNPFAIKFHVPRTMILGVLRKNSKFFLSKKTFKVQVKTTPRFYF